VSVAKDDLHADLEFVLVVVVLAVVLLAVELEDQEQQLIVVAVLVVELAPQLVFHENVAAVVEAFDCD
jgi:uncharacterized membrane protein